MNTGAAEETEAPRVGRHSRPPSLTLVDWGAVAFGLFISLGEVVNLLADIATGRPGPDPHRTSPVWAALDAAYPFDLVLMFGAGLFICVCGAGLLNLKPWARRGLLLAAGVALALTPVMVGLNALDVVDVGRSLGWSGLTSAVTFVFGLAAISVIAVPAALTIKALRSPEARAAVLPVQGIAVQRERGAATGSAEQGERTPPRRTAARPLGLTVTAWVWCVIGVLLVVDGIMLAGMMAVAGDAGSGPGYGYALVGVFAVSGILGVAGGVGMLRLRRWARIILLVLTSVGLAIGAAFGILGQIAWFFGGLARGVPVSIYLLGASIGIVATLIWVVPLRLMLKVLQAEATLAAISSSGLGPDSDR